MTVLSLFQTAEYAAECMYPETRPQAYSIHYQLKISADSMFYLTLNPSYRTRKTLTTYLLLLITLEKGPSHYHVRRQLQQLKLCNCTMSTSKESTEHLRQQHQTEVLSSSQHSWMNSASLWEWSRNFQQCITCRLMKALKYWISILINSFTPL